MIYFISYDIANPKRLCKVAKTLENYGVRVQHSFFECEMEQKVLEKLKRDLLEIINMKYDSLRIYPLCEDCSKKTISCGNGDIYVPSSFMIL